MPITPTTTGTTMSTSPTSPSPAGFDARASIRRALRWEILLVLAVTFGVAGLRAFLRLIESLTDSRGLAEQTAELNRQQSHLPWLDPLLQVISSGVLFAWGGLAIFLLLRHVPLRTNLAPRTIWRMRAKDWLHGAGLAAIIGIPGLLFYVTAVHVGLSKQVDPSAMNDSLWKLPLLVLNSWANGWAEEIIVVAWLATRLRQLRVPWAWVFAGSAVLRGSYHLYQGVSAGFGNIIMGLVYLHYWRKTGRIWPLIIAHGLIDTVAFVGYATLGGVPGL